MYKVVYLTEKDSQVEALAPLLGCKYTKKWHPAYSPDKSIAIVPLQGHLIELYKYPEEYDPGYKDWNEKTTLCFPKEFKKKPKNKTIQILNRAIQHLKQAEKIVIASDFDNEGAALAMEVIEHAGVENRVSHMLEMGSVDTKALKNAIENPIDIPYRNMANAGYARAYIDWAEGMSLTRALTIYLARKRSLVLFGGVKSPLLSMVVERDLQFEEHKSIKFWYLTGLVEAKGKTFEVSLLRKEETQEKMKNGTTKTKISFKREIDSKDIAEQLKNKILQKASFEVSEFAKKTKTENAPQLYDLTSLQAEMAKKYNLTPEDTLSIAQKLYDFYKIQTYPRTAIRYLKEEEYDAVPNILKNLSQVMHKEIIKDILEKPIPKRKSVFNSAKVTSHGALAPTENDLKAVASKLSELEKEAFKIVATRYVANFMEAYEYQSIEGNIHLFDDYYLSFKENKPVKAGYKKIYQADIEDTISSYKRTIPDLIKGDIGTVQTLNINEGETKPKPRFTMETLLNAMKNISNLYPNNPIIKEYLGENGIGTPATRSAILKDLMTPKKEGEEPWLIQKGKQIISTKKAREMIDKVPPEIVSPIKRAEMNKDLTKIEKGELTLEQFLNHYRNQLEDYIEKIKEHAKDPNNFIRSEKEKNIAYLGKCPICEGQIYERPKAYICSNAQWVKNGESWENKGCNFSIFKTALKKFGGKNLSKTDIKKLLNNGELEVTLESQRTKQPYKKKIAPDPKWGIKINF